MKAEKLEVTLELKVVGGNTTINQIAPSVIQMGLDVNKVVADINEATKNFKGLELKIDLLIDTNTRHYKISLPKPKSSELIRERILNNTITKDQIIVIAKILDSKNFETKVKELEGTCKSMNIKVI